MSFVHDKDRLERLGMPEAIFCEGKDDGALAAIVAQLSSAGKPAFLTRLARHRHAALPPTLRASIEYDSVSETGTVHGHLADRRGSVAIVTAGTSDMRIAWEAARTLAFSGFAQDVYADLGVAGIHRLFARMEEISRHDIVIVVAGWDAALASVMGGLVSLPVIAVPSSVGYGVASGGYAALHSMLTSCGQGVLVTNIDNGFGAACGAIRFLNRLDRDKS